MDRGHLAEWRAGEGPRPCSSKASDLVAGDRPPRHRHTVAWRSLQLNHGKLATSPAAPGPKQRQAEASTGSLGAREAISGSPRKAAVACLRTVFILEWELERGFLGEMVGCVLLRAETSAPGKLKHPHLPSATGTREGEAGSPWRRESPNRVHESRGEDKSSRPHISYRQAQGENPGVPRPTPLPCTLCQVAVLIRLRLLHNWQEDKRPVQTGGCQRAAGWERADGTWKV